MLNKFCNINKALGNLMQSGGLGKDSEQGGAGRSQTKMGSLSARVDSRCKGPELEEAGGRGRQPIKVQLAQ